MKKRLREVQARIERGHLPLQIRADTFDEESRSVEVVFTSERPVKRRTWDEGTFNEVLICDAKAVRLERLNNGAPVLDSHDSWSLASVIGTVVPNSARFEGGKGICQIRFSGRPEVAGIVQDIRDGVLSNISVGYKIHKYEMDEGEKDEIPTMRATDWEPMEVSVVPIPADPTAKIRSDGGERFDTCVVVRSVVEEIETLVVHDEQETTEMKKIRKAVAGATGAELEGIARLYELARKEGEADEALRERILAEVEKTEKEETRAAPIAGTTVAPAAPAADAAATEEQVRAAANQAVARDRQRIADIETIGARFRMDEEFVRKHKTAGTTVEAFRLAVLEELDQRQSASDTFPVVETRGLRDEVTTRRGAVTAALLHRFDPAAYSLTEAAREWRGMSLLKTAEELLRANGERTRGMTESEIATRAFHSTSDFPIILGDVVRTTLMQGYNAYQNTFQLIAKRTTATNFKEITRARLGENPELQKVNELGEFPRGTMVEGKESFKIATYGRVIGVSRQMLINDDMNALAGVPSRWGRQVAKLEGDIVWGLIVNNAVMSSDGVALFHANHKNLEGTPSALNLANLGKARKSFRKQTDIDGNRIDLAPKYLFVAVDQEITAQQLLVQVNIPKTAADVIPEALSSIIPVSEYRLDALNNGLSWFLFANPADVDGGLEYAYLAGNEAPYLEERMGFDVDGVEFKVRHDFGAGLTDWRFGYKNAGA